MLIIQQKSRDVSVQRPAKKRLAFYITLQGGEIMENVRCKCGKIVCQLKGRVVLIKCRHCKRFVILEFSDQEGSENGSLANEGRPKIEYR